MSAFSPASSAVRLFSLLFGFLTLTLVANQVATGLALTILGLGVSGMLGEAYVGAARYQAAADRHSGSVGHSVSSVRFCSGRI